MRRCFCSGHWACCCSGRRPAASNPGAGMYWGWCFGLALLSKYTAVLMARAFAVPVFTDERRWLKTVHPRGLCWGWPALRRCCGGIICTTGCHSPFRPAMDWVARNGRWTKWPSSSVASLFPALSFGVRACTQPSRRRAQGQAYAVLVTTSVPVILFLQCRPAQDCVPELGFVCLCELQHLGHIFLLAGRPHTPRGLDGIVAYPAWACRWPSPAMRALASCRWKNVVRRSRYRRQQPGAWLARTGSELQARYPQRTEVVTLSHQPVPSSCTTRAKS